MTHRNRFCSGKQYNQGNPPIDNVVWLTCPCRDGRSQIKVQGSDGTARIRNNERNKASSDDSASHQPMATHIAPNKNPANLDLSEIDMWTTCYARRMLLLMRV